MIDVRTVPGRGIEGRRAADGATVQLGSLRWIESLGGQGEIERARAFAADEPQSAVAIDGRVIGCLWFAETLRPEAISTVAALLARGVRPLILSGDRPERVARIADEIGVEWEAPLLPEGKLERIEALEGQAGGVVMVGDGINDAPSLAAAAAGVALGCGADVSRWSADICLLRDDLSDLPWLADLAARTGRTIRWNLLWAFGYNAALVPLAAAGWVHPTLAALAMLASSLFVVTSSLRLADGSTERATPSAGAMADMPRSLAAPVLEPAGAAGAHR
jgi:P-type E1-E2 ATPase